MRQNDDHDDQGIEGITTVVFSTKGEGGLYILGLVWFNLTYVLLDGGGSPDSQEIPNAY